MIMDIIDNYIINKFTESFVYASHLFFIFISIMILAVFQKTIECDNIPIDYDDCSYKTENYIRGQIHDNVYNNYNY